MKLVLSILGGMIGMGLVFLAGAAYIVTQNPPSVYVDPTAPTYNIYFPPVTVSETRFHQSFVRNTNQTRGPVAIKNILYNNTECAFKLTSVTKGVILTFPYTLEYREMVRINWDDSTNPSCMNVANYVTIVTDLGSFNADDEGNPIP